MRFHCGTRNFQKRVSQFCTAAADQLKSFAYRVLNGCSAKTGHSPSAKPAGRNAKGGLA